MGNQSHTFQRQHRRSASDGGSSSSNSQVDNEFLSMAVPSSSAVTSRAESGSGDAINSHNDLFLGGKCSDADPAVIPTPNNECDDETGSFTQGFGVSKGDDDDELQSCRKSQSHLNCYSLSGEKHAEVSNTNDSCNNQFHQPPSHQNQNPVNSVNWNVLNHWVRPHLRKQSLLLPHCKGSGNMVNDLGPNSLTHKLLQEQEELARMDELMNNPSRFALYVPGHDVQFANTIADLEIDSKDFAALVHDVYDNPEKESTKPSNNPVDRSSTNNSNNSRAKSDVPLFNITGPSSEPIIHSKTGRLNSNRTSPKAAPRATNPLINNNSGASNSNVTNQKNGGEKMFWLDITAPSEEEMEALANAFGLHSLTIEDIMYEPPSTDKFESFKTYDFICFRALAPAHGFAPQMVNEREKVLRRQSQESARPDIRKSISSFIGGVSPVVRRANTTNTSNIHSKAASLRRRDSSKSRFRVSPSGLKDRIHKSIVSSRRSYDSAYNEIDADGNHNSQSKPGNLHEFSKSIHSEAALAPAEAESYSSAVIGDMDPEKSNLDRCETLHNYYNQNSDGDNAGCQYQGNEQPSNSWNEGYVDYDQEKTVPLFIVLLPRGILTFHNSPLSATRRAISRLIHDSIDTVIIPSYAAYAVMDNVIDELLPVSRLLEIEADAVDELVLILTQGEQADMLRRISTERRKVLWMLRILQGKKEVVRALERRVSERIKFFQTSALHNNSQQLHRGHLGLSPITGPQVYGSGYPMHPVNSQPSLYNNGHNINSHPSMNRHNDALNNTEGGTAVDYGHQINIPGGPAISKTRTQELSASPDMIPTIPGGGGVGRGNLPHSDSLFGLYGLNQHNANHYGNNGTFGGGPKGNAPAPSHQETIPSWGTWTDMSRYLNDIQDHLETMSGSIYHCERILSRANLNFMTRVNLMMTTSTFETNDVMANLTAVTVVFLPLNLVAGLWGMNVTVPSMNSDTNNTIWPFYTILGSMILWAILCAILFYKFKSKM
ncbi:Mg(2+) transporter [Mycoemilia scoparia]|uniref:Mg(2+) transporter n=1 Tax=Mycoemilia scoparia TaxID=417184 RepID=A0A9W7ZUR9_9FUNG|nr:Mg(2+) transporter [Mycoemilia scoparia]